MKNIKLISAGGIGIALALFFALNIFSNVIFKSSRLDLTENNLYTLSEGTQNILEKLDEPVTLHFYYSEKLASDLPQLNNYAKEVRELLEEYVAVSDGMVKLIVADPEPFSDAEDQAVQDGLQGVPIDAAGTTAYFGLVGSGATNEKEVIPFFQMEKESTLEYELTRLVYKLGNPKKVVVGLLSDLPINGSGPMNPMMQMQPTPEWMIATQMKQLFDVRELQKDIKKIPKDVDVLMLVHPKNYSDPLLFAIDQFVLAGGRALVFVDPHAESEQAARDPNNPMAGFGPKNSDLKKLFDAWGLEMVSGQLAGDIQSAARVNISQGPRPQAVDYVVWLQMDQENFNHDDFITGDLKTVTMGSAGVLKKKEGANTEFETLIHTSDKAMKIPTTAIQFRPDPAALLNNYHPGGEVLTLAARITGKFKTAFPNGAPEGADSSGEVLKEAKEPGNIIVFSDADMLEDRFWVNVQNFFGQRVAIPRANNGVLVINALDNLGGSNDLISLRSRGRFSRPFERVKEIQREAEKNFRNREKQLQAKLQETERKLGELQRQKGSDNMILSADQQAEIKKFRAEQVKTRKDLRNVQHELQKNIEDLGTLLKRINIIFVPLLIIIIAVAVAVYRQKQRDKLASE